MNSERFAGWRKSSHSTEQSACVEVGADTFRVGVRDAKDRSHGTLAVSRAAWANFLGAIKSGELSR